MICPKCKNETEGKWCRFCGAQLETEHKFNLSPYEDSFEETQKENASEEFMNGNEDDIAQDVHFVTDTKNEKRIKTQDGGKNKAVVIAVISTVCVVIAVLLILVFTVNKNSDTSTQISQSDAVALDVSTLFERGKKFMEVGDYESGEEMFKKLMEMSDDPEITDIYEILFNFNRSKEELRNSELEKALEYFEKIPPQYTDYIISDDVDSLGDDIAQAQTAYSIFDSIKDFISARNYDAAKEAVSIIDISFLNEDDRKLLDEYIKEINEKIKEAKENEEQNIVLSEHDAQSFLMEYCDSFAKAVNSRDSEIIAPYMQADSEILIRQKAVADDCISKNISQSFDFLEVKNIAPAGDNKWTVSVHEGNTLSYKDGQTEVLKYDREYTIEYKDSDYYITKIR